LIKILGFHSIEDVIHGFLGYCAFCVVVGYQYFEGLCFHPTMKMEAAWSSRTLISNHHKTWWNDPENHKLYQLISLCESTFVYLDAHYISYLTRITTCGLKHPLKIFHASW